MNDENIGTITGIKGNLVTVAFTQSVKQNEVAYIISGGNRLKAEVIRIQGSIAELQVYEETRGLKGGDQVAFSGELLSVDLGPGLLGQVYDGLQNPLPDIAQEYGFFMPEGVSLTIWQDDTRLLESRLDTLLKNGRAGLLLVLLVLTLFLRLRLAFGHHCERLERLGVCGQVLQGDGRRLRHDRVSVL